MTDKASVIRELMEYGQELIPNLQIRHAVWSELPDRALEIGIELPSDVHITDPRVFDLRLFSEELADREPYYVVLNTLHRPEAGELLSLEFLPKDWLVGSKQVTPIRQLVPIHSSSSAAHASKEVAASNGNVGNLRMKKLAPYAVAVAALALLVMAPAMYNLQGHKSSIESKAYKIPYSEWERIKNSSASKIVVKELTPAEMAALEKNRYFLHAVLAASEEDYDKLAAEIKGLRQLIENNRGKIEKDQLAVIVTRLEQLEKQQKQTQKQQKDYMASLRESKYDTTVDPRQPTNQDEKER